MFCLCPIYTIWAQQVLNIRQHSSRTKVWVTKLEWWSSSEVLLPAGHTFIDHGQVQEGSRAGRKLRGAESWRGHVDPRRETGTSRTTFLLATCRRTVCRVAAQTPCSRESFWTRDSFGVKPGESPTLYGLFQFQLTALHSGLVKENNIKENIILPKAITFRIAGLQTMFFLSFPKVIFFLPFLLLLLPLPNLPLPPLLPSSLVNFCFATNISLPAGMHNSILTETTMEVELGCSQLPVAQSPSSWSALAFMELGLPVRALPTVVLFTGCLVMSLCWEPASWDDRCPL